MHYWLGFVACSAAIVFCGHNLLRYGDIIAEKSGLGRTWIGLVLVASVTSLPEMVTGMSAVLLDDLPDIAVGAIVGSCVFNLFILAMLDLSVDKVPVTSRTQHGNIIAASFGVLMLCAVALGIGCSPLSAGWQWIGPYTIINAVVYMIAMKIVYDFERKQLAATIHERAEEAMYKDITLKTALIRYAMNSGVVVAAAIFLPRLGEGIAAQTGLGSTFVGNVFIALTTSLPEVVVSVSAIRIGAIDLAIGNLLGSNLFNVLILSIEDMLYFKGPILSYSSPAHLASTVSAMAMSAIVIIGITYRADRKRMLLAWDSQAVVFLFIINTLLLYLFK